MGKTFRVTDSCRTGRTVTQVAGSAAPRLRPAAWPGPGAGGKAANEHSIRTGICSFRPDCEEQGLHWPGAPTGGLGTKHLWQPGSATVTGP